jgi:hypothetical protein
MKGKAVQDREDQDYHDPRIDESRQDIGNRWDDVDHTHGDDFCEENAGQNSYKQAQWGITSKRMMGCTRS